MAQALQKTLPGINPGQTNRLTYTDTPLPDADTTLDPSQLLHGSLTMTPLITNRTVTLPSASAMLSGTQMTGAIPGHSVVFQFRNQAQHGGFAITLNLGTGGVADANATLIVPAHGIVTYIVRISDANPTSPAYTLFQSGFFDIGGGVLRAASVIALGAAAGTTTFDMTVPAFQLLANTTLTVNTILTGVTLTGPNAAGTTTLTFPETGDYDLHISLNGGLTTAAVGGVTTLGLSAGINGVIPTMPMAHESLEDALVPLIQVNMTGNAILTFNSGDVLDIYIAGLANIAAGDTFDATFVNLTIHKF